jgi:hypothetical protein
MEIPACLVRPFATADADPVTGSLGSCPYRISAVFYYFSFVVFGICLLCNLFVAILLERFDYASTMEGVGTRAYTCHP